MPANPRPRSRWRWLVGPLFALALFFLLGEVVVRQLDLVDQLNGYPRAVFLATDDLELPYVLRPGFRGQWGIADIRVNDLGLRGAEVSREPGADVHRILALGDSVVFGWFTLEKESFTVALERELRRCRGEGVEVLNGGVPGYNTRAEVAFLRERGLDLEPSELIVGVSFNDLGGTPVIAPSGFLSGNADNRATLPWLANHSEFYVLLRWLAWRGASGALFRSSPRAPKDQTGAGAEGVDAGEQLSRSLGGLIAKRQTRFYRQRKGPGWDRIRGALQDLSELAREHELPVTLVLFPAGYQFGVDEPDLSPQRAWLDLCEEFELRCVDPWPAFAATGADAGTVLFGDVQHPNGAGAGIAARVVAEELGCGGGAQP